MRPPHWKSFFLGAFTSLALLLIAQSFTEKPILSSLPTTTHSEEKASRCECTIPKLKPSETTPCPSQPLAGDKEQAKTNQWEFLPRYKFCFIFSINSYCRPSKPTSKTQLITWNAFSEKYIYSDQQDIQVYRTRSKSSWRKHDVQAAVDFGRQEVFKSLAKELRSVVGIDFIQGHSRDVRRYGIEYVLDYKLTSSSRSNATELSGIRRIRAARRLSAELIPLNSVEKVVHSSNDVLHLVMAVAGRRDVLEDFIERLNQLLSSPDEPSVHIVLVCHVTDLTCTSLESNNAKVLSLTIHKVQRDFARGYYLEEGIRSIKTVQDPLVFICDMDMVISPGFLTRCHASAKRGSQVSYPIVFSQYRGEKLKVDQKAGKFRTYGYGMFCGYREDFLVNGGYDDNITTWGSEDVKLFDRMVRKSNLEIFRAVEPGLIHKWHEKVCDNNVGDKKLSRCRRSAAEYEGSKSAIGEMLMACVEENGVNLEALAKKVKE
eukprot:m.47772 g.47772  ORF g.47772 m.47772 type:complete len:488 (-) comp10532_c0_seq2:52-1515(-)